MLSPKDRCDQNVQQSDVPDEDVYACYCEGSIRPKLLHHLVVILVDHRKHEQWYSPGFVEGNEERLREA